MLNHMRKVELKRCHRHHKCSYRLDPSTWRSNRKLEEIEKGKQEIFMKTVLNNEEGLSKISTCKKIEKFDKES